MRRVLGIVMSAVARVGLGWRPALAAGILSHLDRIDVLEVLAEDAIRASAAERRSLRALAREVPVWVHAVSLGLASTAPVDPKRLSAIARVVGELEPEGFSEHLAFVRGGGVEIGHLAAPPRNAATIDGCARNVEATRRAVGRMPVLENVATLIVPPGSDRSEVDWVVDVLGASGAELLLDLHNLHANATNFRWDPRTMLDRVPAERVRMIHVAGGHQGERLVDDHVHDVPDVVFELLADVARRSKGPMTVVLERDGAFPSITSLIGELDRAREAIRVGRARHDVARV